MSNKEHVVFNDDQVRRAARQRRFKNYFVVGVIALGVILFVVSIVQSTEHRDGFDRAIIVLLWAWLSIFMAACVSFVWKGNTTDEIEPLDGPHLNLLKDICERNPTVNEVVREALSQGLTLRMRDYHYASAIDKARQSLEASAMEAAAHKAALDELSNAVGAERR